MRDGGAVTLDVDANRSIMLTILMIIIIACITGLVVHQVHPKRASRQ